MEESSEVNLGWPTAELYKVTLAQVGGLGGRGQGLYSPFHCRTVAIIPQAVMSGF